MNCSCSVKGGGSVLLLCLIHLCILSLHRHPLILLPCTYTRYLEVGADGFVLRWDPAAFLLGILSVFTHTPCWRKGAQGAGLTARGIIRDFLLLFGIYVIQAW